MMLLVQLCKTWTLYRRDIQNFQQQQGKCDQLQGPGKKANVLEKGNKPIIELLICKTCSKSRRAKVSTIIPRGCSLLRNKGQHKTTLKSTGFQPKSLETHTRGRIN